MEVQNQPHLRFQILTAFIALLLIAPHWGEASPETKVASQPNILFCVADDWGWALAGAYADRMVHYADCDDGPTKSVVRGIEQHPRGKELYELSFGKRPAVELYDCLADPAQTNNLAARPEYAETIEQLCAKLVAYLKETGDPRFTDQAVKFDGYPFR